MIDIAHIITQAAAAEDESAAFEAGDDAAGVRLAAVLGNMADDAKEASRKALRAVNEIRSAKEGGAE